LNSLYSFLKYLLSIFFFTLKSLLISIYGLFHLSVVVFDSLFLESNLLIFKSFFSFVIDLAWSHLIHCLIILSFKIFNFCNLPWFFRLRFLSKFFQLFVFVLNLVVKTFFLIFKWKNSTISLWYFRGKLFYSLVHVLSFFWDFLCQFIMLCTRIIL
jgi:hypothetical protein